MCLFIHSTQRQFYYCWQFEEEINVSRFTTSRRKNEEGACARFFREKPLNIMQTRYLISLLHKSMFLALKMISTTCFLVINKICYICQRL